MPFFRTPRKIYGITIPQTNDSIICFDKHGDVLRIPLVFSPATPVTPSLATYLTGSKSTLTRISLSPDNKYLAISDKDEKIRVTEYPAVNSIQSICFSHTEPVSTIHWVPTQSLSLPPNHSPRSAPRTASLPPYLLLSAGLDGAMCLFDPSTGGLLAKHYLPPFLFTEDDQSDEAIGDKESALLTATKPAKKQKQRKIKFDKQTVCFQFSLPPVFFY